MPDSKLHNAKPAGFLRRLMAALYDWLLVVALMMVASVPVVAISDEPVSPGQAWYRLALIAVAAIFFIAFWSKSGQTLGMRAWHIKLEQVDGTPAGVNRATRRFVAAIISALAGGLGFIWVIFSRENLSWHDLWSGTRIRHYPKTDLSTPRSANALHSGPGNSSKD